MNRSILRRLAALLGVVVVLVGLCALPTPAQDPNLPPTYGWARLRVGFLPDPYVREVVAGGPIYTYLGGVSAFVANAPDFRVYYTAGNAPLTFFVSSRADTTLLINLPDGRWIADDDSGGNYNPMIRLRNPSSGRYDIWVGTVQRNPAPATLFVTELR